MQSNSQATNGVIPKREEILQDVIRIVAEQLGIEADSIQQSDALFEDLACDSLDIVEITMELEEHFDISISDEFADTTRTVGAIVDGLQKLLASVR